MGTEKQLNADESINYKTAHIIASYRQLVDSLSSGSHGSSPTALIKSERMSVSYCTEKKD